MEYIDFSGQAGSQESIDDLGGAPAVQHYNAGAIYGQDQPNASYLNGNYGAPMSCDIKPRLTKEQHDLLENHYQKHNKPNTNTKKGFADSLGVSLDKVNNWFQNRRAKSKQDAKKNATTINIFPAHVGSDSDTSPGFVNPSSTYHSMYQQWSVERGSAHGLGISPAQHIQEQQQLQAYAGQDGAVDPDPFQSYLAPTQLNGNGQEDIHRRTLTQEQFDNFERNGGMVDAYGTFEDFNTSFVGDQEIMNAVFPNFNGGVKQEEMFNYPIGAPLSSYDSTVPSNISEQSLSAHPSLTNIQTPAGISPKSDWANSRSSSVQDGATTQMSHQHQPPATTAQWQPGQSIPVDPTAQYETFQQVAAQAAQARGSPQVYEPNPSWPDEAFLRRASTTSLLTHRMSNVGLQTPPIAQGAAFKSPTPASNIAARRQRAPRPAALGVAALRSQSHTGLPQIGSPVQIPQHPMTAADQSLRRIRSSNQLGGIASGRVMKSTPGSARISPTHYNFDDAMNSPYAVRHASQTNLAPPTPMSPKQSAPVEQPAPTRVQQWHPAPGNQSRQASMNENDTEHSLAYQPLMMQPMQQRNSPPQTPMNYQQHFFQSRMHPNTIMENTPPQSASASQTCFAPGVYSVPHQSTHVPHHAVLSQPPAQQQIHPAAMSKSHPHQYIQPAPLDQQYQSSNIIFTPNQSVNIPTTTGPPPGAHFQFSNGVPMTNDHGNIELFFPPQMQFVHHHHQSQPQPPTQHMHTPPQVPYPFGTSTQAPTGITTSSQMSKTPSDFFVHEYAPPEAIKRAATPRKGPIDNAPKNYAFANSGPEHFQKKHDARQTNGVDFKDSFQSSSSPASSSGAALTG